MPLYDKLKNQAVMSILKIIVSKYFNDLKVKGYKLEVSDDNQCYKIVAQLPKESINNLVNKIKK